MRLHVEVEGPPDGPPVVFLHGVSGSLRTYAWLTGAITEGRRIVGALRGRLSGVAQPTYVLDVPGGAGKVPIGPNAVEAGQVRDPAGRLHPYPE